jgi:hypothetical protein
MYEGVLCSSPFAACPRMDVPFSFSCAILVTAILVAATTKDLNVPAIQRRSRIAPTWSATTPHRRTWSATHRRRFTTPRPERSRTTGSYPPASRRVQLRERSATKPPTLLLRPSTALALPRRARERPRSNPRRSWAMRTSIPRRRCTRTLFLSGRAMMKISAPFALVACSR